MTEVAGIEDPKCGKDEPCQPEIASGPLVTLPAPHEDGAPTIEGLHKDELPSTICGNKRGYTEDVT